MNVRILAASFLLLAAPTVGLAQADPLADRLTAIQQNGASAQDCAAAAARADLATGPELLAGSATCAAAGGDLDASVLLSLGQLRAMADMLLMVPATKADSDAQTALYGVLYYSAGGPGSYRVLRDAALRDQLFARILDWAPEAGADYDPGWSTRRRPDPAIYAETISKLKVGRVDQLRDFATRVSDPEYWALQQRMDALQATTGGRYVEGTADAALIAALNQKMNDRARAMGFEVFEPPTPEEMKARAHDFPPTAPGIEETAARADDPVAVQCASQAERLAIAREQSVARVLITASEEWGTIYRADLTSDSQSDDRFTCTETTSASEPLVGEQVLPPLP